MSSELFLSDPGRAPQSGSLQDWVGRTEQSTELIDARAVEAMAATLDLERSPKQGEPLPPGWQWLFFNPRVRSSGLGLDGHPQRGGFLPPVELPRRMWAGSRLNYLGALTLGEEATRRSRIAKVEEKKGKAGALCFVTVEHTLSSGGVDRIIEEQDIVYREPPPPDSGAATPPSHQAEAQWQTTINPDPVLLFRYSALTFNGHRIHYDQAYARNEEGYPDLVVQGPLTATLLQHFATQQSGGRRLKTFSFRGVTPLFVNRPFQIEARADGDDLDVWARAPEGQLAMSARASFD